MASTGLRVLQITYLPLLCTAGMRAIQAQFERPGQLDIAHPTSEPSQGAVASPQGEPTVVNLPRSAAMGESPDSIGMRIPAAVRWSFSPKSNQPSPTRPSDDGKGSLRNSGSSLLERLRNAARRAVRSLHFNIITGCSFCINTLCQFCIEKFASTSRKSSFRVINDNMSRYSTCSTCIICSTTPTKHACRLRSLHVVPTTSARTSRPQTLRVQPPTQPSQANGPPPQHQAC